MRIIIYTAPACAYCQMAKEFFKRRKVAYEEKDVSADEKARDEMVKKSGQMGVPVIEIDGKIINGFDEESLSEILNNNDVRRRYNITTSDVVILLSKVYEGICMI